jgi:hypothetical protein
MCHVMAYIREGLKHIKHKLWRNVLKKRGVIYVLLFLGIPVFVIA